MAADGLKSSCSESKGICLAAHDFLLLKTLNYQGPAYRSKGSGYVNNIEG
jgi:hypothetical protein